MKYHNLIISSTQNKGVPTGVWKCLLARGDSNKSRNIYNLTELNNNQKSDGYFETLLESFLELKYITPLKRNHTFCAECGYFLKS